MQIIKNPQVFQDLVALADHIAENNPEIADRFIDAFDTTIERIAQFPHIGTNCQFRALELQGIRRWFIQGFERYLLFYRVTNDTLEIVRLLHSSRDIEQALGQEN